MFHAASREDRLSTVSSAFRSPMKSSTPGLARGGRLYGFATCQCGPWRAQSRPVRRPGRGPTGDRDDLHRRGVTTGVGAAPVPRLGPPGPTSALGRNHRISHTPSHTAALQVIARPCGSWLASDSVGPANADPTATLPPQTKNPGPCLSTNRDSRSVDHQGIVTPRSPQLPLTALPSTVPSCSTITYSLPSVSTWRNCTSR